MTGPDQPAEIDRVPDSDPAPTGGPVKTAEEYEQEVLDEWNTYVAVYALDFYGSRAYNPGHPVPVSAVASHGGWVPDDAVRRIDTDREQTPVAAAGVPAVTVIRPAGDAPATATAPLTDTSADAAEGDAAKITEG